MSDSLEKLTVLKRDNESNPFSANRFSTNYSVKEIFENFIGFTKLELLEKNFLVKIAGRIMRIRNFGNLCFAVLRNFDGDIQLVAVKSKEFSSLRIGDIVGVDGVVYKSDRGELSVKVSSFQLFSKCLKTIPDFHYGFSDVEERFRNRHLDFIVNKSNRDIIVKRSRIIKFVRKFFDDLGFVEVETPILVSEASGAQAKPFRTYYNSLGQDFNLRIATEIPLKTLIIAGFEKVYEIGKVFRNEGIDARHNPEFTTIEIYEAYQNSTYMMNLTEKLVFKLKEFLSLDQKLKFNDCEIIISSDFERISMVDSVRKFSGVDFSIVNSFEEAKDLAFKNNVSLDKHQNSVGHVIIAFFESFVEKNLLQPTFIYDYPIETSPLAKAIEGRDKFADRFELFIGGLEFANGYSELNDAEEQQKRFEEQLREKKLGNDEIAGFDSDFVEALRYGMPPTGGLGIGIDRLVMLLSERNNVREVVAFPQMKKR